MMAAQCQHNAYVRPSILEYWISDIIFQIFFNISMTRSESHH